MKRITKRNVVAVFFATLFAISILTPAAAAPPAPTPTPDFLAKLPRDEKGRVIGGELFPVINYSPAMVAGMPCPRVTKWEFDVLKMQPPLRDYGVARNPCVVQNAVDDLVRTLWFNPAFQNPETMKAVAKVYDTDPMNVNGVEKTLRQSLIDLYRKGQQNYNVCDKPVFRLLYVDAKAPLIADNDGRVSGQAIQIVILRATRDVQPFECKFVSYKDGSVKGSFKVTAEDMRKPFGVKVSVFNLLWNTTTKRWVVYAMDAQPAVEDYPATARVLWSESSIKP
jgi:hypothetical protein